MSTKALEHLLEVCPERLFPDEEKELRDMISHYNCLLKVEEDAKALLDIIMYEIVPAACDRLDVQRKTDPNRATPYRMVEPEYLPTTLEEVWEDLVCNEQEKTPA